MALSSTSRREQCHMLDESWLCERYRRRQYHWQSVAATYQHRAIDDTAQSNAIAKFHDGYSSNGDIYGRLSYLSKQVDNLH